MNDFHRPFLDRRQFLTGALALATASLWSCGKGRPVPALAADPFQLGIASGDPTADGIVLWTRLAPLPLDGGGMPPVPVEVRWELAADESFRRIVQHGTVDALPELAHSVHVEVAGLQPARWYWYRFHCGKDVSPVGRTRTLPAPGTLPERFRFAFASCQNFEYGLFTAYDHLVREDLDLVIHLGDYIYEMGSHDGRVRKHVGPACTTLEHYRTRYGLYKGDPSLRAMHAAAPWVVTPDDHEVANDYAGDRKGDSDPATFLRRRAAAYQAYYEHMPLRRSALPSGADMTLYRRLSAGNLVDFNVLDTRQYRTPLPGSATYAPQGPEALAPTQSLMGARQKQWLFAGLGRSTARWNVLAQQVMMARVDCATGPTEGYAMDKWPGYEMERRELLAFLANRRIANPVVLTGDWHSNWANELVGDFSDLGGRTIAPEFIGTSISSRPKVGALDEARVKAENPCVKFLNHEHGYVRCDITPAQWRTDYCTIPQIERPGAPLNVRASFLLTAGDPTLQAV